MQESKITHHFDIVAYAYGVKKRARKVQKHRFNMCILDDDGVSDFQFSDDLRTKALHMVQSEMREVTGRVQLCAFPYKSKHYDGYAMKEMRIADPRYKSELIG